MKKLILSIVVCCILWIAVLFSCCFRPTLITPFPKAYTATHYVLHILNLSTMK
ncbi:MAG: hypothetical protein J6V50_00890 [Clostridia bacterium]|nr:hypothetical protein [Clostridia bacterium]